MVNPLIALPSNNKTPLQVHVNRNGFKESLHEVDVAVCDADGSVILGMGDEVGDITTPDFVLTG